MEYQSPPTQATGVFPFSQRRGGTRPPQSDPRSPGRISRLGEYPTHISDGNSARKAGNKKETIRGNQSFQKLIQFLHFSGLFIYLFVIRRDEYRVTQGSADLTLVTIR